MNGMNGLLRKNDLQTENDELISLLITAQKENEKLKVLADCYEVQHSIEIEATKLVLDFWHEDFETLSIPALQKLRVTHGRKEK